MSELTDVYFKKDGTNLTKIVFGYKPSGSKVYSPSDEYSSGLLDKVLGIKRDILKKGSTVEKKSFHPRGFKSDKCLNRFYTSEEFQVNEHFSDFSNIMGCTFDIINIGKNSKMHACFSVIPPQEDYSIDAIYLFVNGKRHPPLPYDLGYAEALIRENILSVSPQRVAAKV